MGIHCHDMKKGQIFKCEDCGLALQVIEECKECGTDKGECGCSAPCVFQCCGDSLKLKK